MLKFFTFLILSNAFFYNPIFAKDINKKWKEKDITAFVECHNEDYELVTHSTREVKKMEDIDWNKMMEWMVAANVEKHRCIYENDDIIVEHQIISYGSGDREALMLVHQLKDGLMWRTESGATPLPKKV